MRIRFRHATSAAFATANPLLLAGEPAYESDTGRQKLGNGVDKWNTLPYLPYSLGDGGMISCITNHATPAKKVWGATLNPGKFLHISGTLIDKLNDGSAAVGSRFGIDIHVTRSKDARVVFEGTPLFTNGNYLKRGASRVAKIFNVHEEDPVWAVVIPLEDAVIAAEDHLVEVYGNGYSATYESITGEMTPDEDFFTDADEPAFGVIKTQADGVVTLVLDETSPPIQVGDTVTGDSSGKSFEVTGISETDIPTEEEADVDEVANEYMLSYGTVDMKMLGAAETPLLYLVALAPYRENYDVEGISHTAEWRLQGKGEQLALGIGNINIISGGQSATMLNGMVFVLVHANSGHVSVIAESLHPGIREPRKWDFRYELITDDDELEIETDQVTEWISPE